MVKRKNHIKCFFFIIHESNEMSLSKWKSTYENTYISTKITNYSVLFRLTSHLMKSVWQTLIQTIFFKKAFLAASSVSAHA